MVSVSDYLQDLNGRTFLPGLQREFVWDQHQIENLFDSLMRDYPIGLVTRWDAARSADNFHAYEFITNFIDDEGLAPDSLGDNGYTRYNSQVDKDTPDFLVIDGQQRLTSLNIGLFGRRVKYTSGRGGKRDNLGDWSSYELCINLFGHPDYQDNDVMDDYELKFRRTSEFDENNRFGYYESEQEDGGVIKRFWFPLPEIMDGETKTAIPDSDFHNKTDKLIEDLELPSGKKADLKNIKRSVFSDFSSNVLQHDIPTKDIKKESKHIKEIFQRINVEGVKPLPYQLLLSKMMSIWPFYEDGSEKTFNPRQQIEEWVENFKEEFNQYETSINRELFLRYSCYLENHMMKTNSVKSLTEAEMISMRDSWYFTPEVVTVYDEFEWFRSSLQKAFQTLVNIGFTQDTMDTMSMVAAIGKFYYQNPDADPDDPDNLNAIYRFLSHLILHSRSKGSIGRVEARRVSEFLDEQEFGEYTVFPADEAFKHLDVEIAHETVEKVVEEARYPSKTPESQQFANEDIAAILGLASGIYTQDNISDYEVDHIFPSSKSEEVEDRADTDDAYSIHRLGNLQLLPRTENQKKGDKLPAIWEDDLADSEIAKYRRYNSYKGLSLDPENYQAFVEEREKRLVEKVMEELSQ